MGDIGASTLRDRARGGARPWLGALLAAGRPARMGALVDTPLAVVASVVIACHTEDRWDSLLLAVASAQSQTPAPAQVIVVVDHNERLYRRLAAEARAIDVIDHRGVAGASAARNAGAARAGSPLLAFLDDDVRACEGWLRELLAPFSDPKVVGTGGRTIPAWQHEVPGWFPDEFGWVVGASYAGLPTRTAPVRNVWSENMALRREAFEAVGGFRSGFGKVGLTSLTEDDTDLCIRVGASAPGHRWLYVPTALVEHEVPPERSTFPFFLRRSYLEGVGKMQMSSLLAADSDLGTERAYLTRTLPIGIVRALRARELRRALAIVAGTIAAATGALVGLVNRRRATGRS